MSYSIEIRLAAKSGWHTPAEARAYYGRYDRHGITWHWWGAPGQVGTHDATANYILRKAEQGTGSVNYVLSNKKITMLVNPDNVAWTSQGGNPVTVSVELEPTLNAEGYKRAGWLAKELAGRYGGDRKYYPHNYWYSTQCPGTISLDRIRQEEDKWQRGDYTNPPAPTPTPTPTPPPAGAKLTWTEWKEGKRTYVINKDTHLWNFNSKTWQMQAVKPFKKGEIFEVYGQVRNDTLGAMYYLTEYSFKNKITNGVNAADLDVYAPPVPVPPTPPPTPTPEPIPPAPEWVTNLRDIDDTTMWFKNDAKLWDIVNNKPALDKEGREITFKKDDKFVFSALTRARNTDYRITDYSHKKGIFNGVKVDDLTLTPPGVPDIPPVPIEPDRNAIIAFLELLAKMITEFLAKFKKG